MATRCPTGVDPSKSRVNTDKVVPFSCLGGGRLRHVTPLEGVLFILADAQLVRRRAHRRQCGVARAHDQAVVAGVWIGRESRERLNSQTLRRRGMREAVGGAHSRGRWLRARYPGPLRPWWSEGLEPSGPRRLRHLQHFLLWLASDVLRRVRSPSLCTPLRSTASTRSWLGATGSSTCTSPHLVPTTGSRSRRAASRFSCRGPSRTSWLL